METRQIYEFITPEGIIPIRDVISLLTETQQQKIENRLAMLRRRSCLLQPPLVKAFRQSRHKGLFELRIRSNRVMMRIIFCLD